MFTFCIAINWHFFMSFITFSVCSRHFTFFIWYSLSESYSWLWPKKSQPTSVFSLSPVLKLSESWLTCRALSVRLMAASLYSYSSIMADVGMSWISLHCSLARKLSRRPSCARLNNGVMSYCWTPTPVATSELPGTHIGCLISHRKLANDDTL